MRTDAFDYSLPPELIAQHPPPGRADSRLMVLHRNPHRLQISTFPHLALHLAPGDLLVRNNSKVIPARLRGRKTETGGLIEILLLEPLGGNRWTVLLRPGKRVRPGSRVRFGPESDSLEARVVAKDPDGQCELDFDGGGDVLAFADRHGEMPLPPYIEREHREPADRDRYQTVYAAHAGSAAAPTAGLHFTRGFLEELQSAGVGLADVTLHVGTGTFAPVKAERLEDHVMHEERFDLPAETVEAIERTRRAGRRVVAIGTTTLRVLESVARAHGGRLVPGPGRTRLFVHPPADFHVVDALLTNFHLPRSTLLMLVSAFASPGSTEGRDRVLAAYAEAVRLRFRFFSYGDAMLLI